MVSESVFSILKNSTPALEDLATGWFSVRKKSVCFEVFSRQRNNPKGFKGMLFACYTSLASKKQPFLTPLATKKSHPFEHSDRNFLAVGPLLKLKLLVF